MPQIVNLSSGGIRLRREQGFDRCDLDANTADTPADDVSSLIIDVDPSSITPEISAWAASRNIRVVAVFGKRPPVDDTQANLPLIIVETDGISEALHQDRVPKPIFRKQPDYPVKS